jgi:hypothetical protein
LAQSVHNDNIKRNSNPDEETKMINKYGNSQQVLHRESFTSSLNESVIDVTDLIYHKKFPHISGSLFNMIGRGAARLEIKENRVKLIFKILQDRKEWEETYLTN